MYVRDILSYTVIVFCILIVGFIVNSILFPILRVGMYTGSNKILLSINPLLWLFPFIVSISGIIGIIGIIYHLKKNLSI
jgi:hypothetical protein